MVRNRNQLQPDSDRQVNEGNAPDQHRDPRRDVVEDLQKFQVIFVLLGRHDHHFQKTGSPCGPTLPDRDPELDCCTSTGNLRSPTPLGGPNPAHQYSHQHSDRRPGHVGRPVFPLGRTV